MPAPVFVNGLVPVKETAAPVLTVTLPAPPKVKPPVATLIGVFTVKILAGGGHIDLAPAGV